MTDKTFSTFGALPIGAQFIDPRYDELCQKTSDDGAKDRYCFNGFEISFSPHEAVQVAPLLRNPTPAELRAIAELREREAAIQRAREIAPPADGFVLTGSKRPADEAIARGQLEL